MGLALNEGTPWLVPRFPFETKNHPNCPPRYLQQERYAMADLISVRYEPSQAQGGERRLHLPTFSQHGT